MPPKKQTEEGAMTREGEILVCMIALLLKKDVAYLQDLTRLWELYSGQPKIYNSVKTAVRPWVNRGRELAEKDAAANGTGNEDGDEPATPKSAPKGRKKPEGLDLNKTKTGRVSKSKKKVTEEVDEEECDDILNQGAQEEVDTEA